MPQPLRPDAPVSITPDAIKERPALAVHIATIAAKWSVIEFQLGLALGKMIDAPTEAGLAIYLTLTSMPARKKALKAAAKGRLDKDRSEWLDEIIRVLGNRGDERNTVVHGLWGTTPNHPDGLVLCPSDDYVTMYAHSRRMQRFGAKRLQDAFPQNPKHSLWKEHDFTAIIDRLTEFSQELTGFLDSFEPLPPS